MTQHRSTGDASCSCGTPGFISTLSCGHRTWSHGEPRIGLWISCYPAIGVAGCQAQRKVTVTEPCTPAATAGASTSQPEGTTP